MGQKIFISYKSDDRKKVEKIVDNLETLGFQVWYDQELKTGEKWWKKILSEIRNADIFIFMMSEKSLKSVACKKEWHYALDLKKPILPIQLGKEISHDIIFDELREINILSYHPSFLDIKHEVDWIKNLSKNLNHRRDEIVPLPNPLPTEPTTPMGSSKLCVINEKLMDNIPLSLDEQKIMIADLQEILHSSTDPKGAMDSLKDMQSKSWISVLIADQIKGILGHKDNDLKKYMLFIILGATVVFLGLFFTKMTEPTQSGSSKKIELEDKNITTSDKNIDVEKPKEEERKVVPHIKTTPILKICGSNMLNHEIMPKLVQKFLKEQGYSDVHGEKEHDLKQNIFGTKDGQQYMVEIKADGTFHGYTDLKDKTCDIAVSYGEMEERVARGFDFDIKNESNQFEDAFAFDAIAIVVNKSNNIDSLTSHQIRRIFHGDITRWSEIAGSGKRGKIILYTMDETSGIYHEFVHDLNKKIKMGSMTI